MAAGRRQVLNMTARNSETVRFGPYRFTPGDGLWRGADEVALPPRALNLLTALLARPGLVVSKQELMDAVWPDAYVTESSLLEAIGVLREALADDRRQPAYIQTVHRRGYRFIGVLETETGSEFVDASETSPGLPFFSGPEWRPIYAACAAYFATGVAMAIVFAAVGQRPVAQPTSRFSIALPSDAPVDPLRGSVAVSVDGSRMVYVATGDGGSQLFLRTIDRDAPTPIEGSDDATGPFFSPDGEWIGFFAHGSLQKLPLAGGRPIALCAARAGAGATWTADGTIVFGGGPGGGLARVSSSNGEPVVLSSPEAGSREIRYGWPDVLPGNRGILYTAISVAGSDLAVLDQQTGARRIIATQAAFGRYSPTGHVVFERLGRLEAAPFSLTTLSFKETPRPILSGVSMAGLLDGPRFAFSRTGALIYVPRAADEDEAPLHWPDAGGQLRPNGLEIAFAYSKAGPLNLFIKPLAGQDEAAALITSPWNQFPTSWAPDARQLAFTEFQPLTGADIWVVDVETRQRRPFVRTLFDETWARFSPDGRWLAYMSNESGRWDIYARDVAGVGPRVRISTKGGVWPSWSLDGRTVYFSANGRTLAAAVGTGPTLAFSTPFAIPDADAMVLASGGTAGDRLLFRGASQPLIRSELRVVLEWFSELTRLAQAG
jgi:serine/threonine-protein kinase